MSASAECFALLLGRKTAHGASGLRSGGSGTATIFFLLPSGVFQATRAHEGKDITRKGTSPPLTPDPHTVIKVLNTDCNPVQVLSVPR